MLKEGNVTKIFMELYFLILDKKDCPNIREKIYQIYNQNPEDFLEAVQSLTSATYNRTSSSLLHTAVREGKSEIVATISEIYFLFKTISKSYSRRPTFKSVKDLRSILGREVYGSRITPNKILELKIYDDFTLLHEAVRHNHFDIVEWLIYQGVNLNPRSDSSLETPLMLSINTGNYKIFSLLLKNKANIEATDRGGDTALVHAVNLKKTDFIKKLLEFNADININKGNILFLTAFGGDLEMIKIFLEHAEKNHIKLENVEFAISEARGKHAKEIVEILTVTLKSYETWDLLPVEEATSIEAANSTPVSLSNQRNMSLG